MKERTGFIIKEYIFILMFSLAYSVGLVFFVFPHSTMLGGTGGISVIISAIFSSSPAFIMLIINLSLLVLAFIFLGKNVGIKTLVGTVLVAVFSALLEKYCVFLLPPIKSAVFSSFIGGVIVAASSAGLFNLSASSGGTDVIALIINKYKKVQLGRALLITDIVIVLGGGIVLGLKVCLISALAFLTKVILIDLLVNPKKTDKIE